MDSQYAFVGNWLFRPEPKGFDLFRWEEPGGRFTLCGSYLEEYTIGQTIPGKLPNLVYMVNEAAEHGSVPGSGGSVLAVRLDRASGRAEVVSDVPSCGSKPSYCAVSGDGRFLLVSHHSARSYVTKVRRDQAGRIRVEPDHDDTTLVLFRLQGDGSIGGACDMLLTEGDEAHPRSFLHSVQPNPSGSMFAVCDPGADRIYMVALDGERGCLLLKDTAHVELGYEPRYSVFHPEKPLLFVNNERRKVIFTYRYDQTAGKLERLSEVWLRCPEGELSGPIKSCDIKIHPSGKFLYTSVSGEDHIYVLSILEDGTLKQLQAVPCGGGTPRGLLIAPDGKRLFCANVMSGNVTGFAINRDGTLSFEGEAARSRRPGNLAII